MLTTGGRKNCQIILARASSYYSFVNTPPTSSRKKLLEKRKDIDHYYSKRCSSSILVPAFSTTQSCTFTLPRDAYRKSFLRTLRGKSSLPPSAGSGGSSGDDDGSRKNDSPNGSSPSKSIRL